MASSAVTEQEQGQEYDPRKQTGPCYCCGKPNSPMQDYGCETETVCQYCYDKGHLCDGPDTPTKPGHTLGRCKDDSRWNTYGN